MKIAGETVEVVIEAREGTLYITGRHAYKVFGKNVNPYDVMGTYHDAQQRGVPVPTTNAKFTTELEAEGGKRTVQGVVSSRGFGRFFQLSKRGGEAVLIREIESATNRELLKTLMAGLNASAEAGVTDPQGFVNVHSNPPLCLIDIHMGSSRTGAFDQVIAAAEERLKALG